MVSHPTRSSPRLRGLPGEPPPGAGSLEVIPAPAGEPRHQFPKFGYLAGTGHPAFSGSDPSAARPCGAAAPGFRRVCPSGAPNHVWRRNRGLWLRPPPGGSLPPVARGVGAIRRAAMTVDAPPRRIASAAARKCTPHARLSGRERDRNATRVEKPCPGPENARKRRPWPPRSGLSILD